MSEGLTPSPEELGLNVVETESTALLNHELDFALPQIFLHLPESYHQHFKDGAITEEELESLSAITREYLQLFYSEEQFDYDSLPTAITGRLGVAVVPSEKASVNDVDQGWEELARNPDINWSAALATDARSGDYEPAEWVTDFKELPELVNIPEPAQPDKMLLVHWVNRRTEYTKFDKFTELPESGEICCALMTLDEGVGNPVGLVLRPHEGAIKEMHIVDIDSAPGYEDMPPGQRKAANPSDRRVLRQLQDLNRLTPEQIAVLHPFGWNELFVESSQVEVMGIIYIEEDSSPKPEILSAAAYYGYKIYTFNQTDRQIRLVNANIE